MRKFIFFNMSRFRCRDKRSEMARLSAEEIRTYREEGLVIPKYNLTGDLFAELRDDCERLIRDNSEIRPEKLISAHLEKRPGRTEGLRGGGRILRYATHWDILDLVEQLIGPDIILWGSALFAKPGREGMEVPWHQDGHYWPIRPLAAITVWIAIDDSTTENGCMRYIPGSHKSGVFVTPPGRTSGSGT
jgi:ectoine hydroxylase-related dioxygenase (phytanoyl-CoA dioxygenase family)